jgi:hypothetical protein
VIVLDLVDADTPARRHRIRPVWVAGKLGGCLAWAGRRDGPLN